VQDKAAEKVAPLKPGFSGISRSRRCEGERTLRGRKCHHYKVRCSL